MPRVTPLDPTSSTASWIPQESDSSSKNSNKNEEPDQDSENTKK